MRYFLSCEFSSGDFVHRVFDSPEDVYHYLDDHADSIVSLSIIKGEYASDICEYWSDNFVCW